MDVGFDILKTLEIFIGVTETGSMTGASKRLGVTQSAISQQIKLLEADLGTALFDRQSRPLRLTSAGITLHQRAARLILDAKDTWMCTRQASHILLPQLRLAVLSTLAVPLVPALIQAMERKQISVETMSFVRGTSRCHTHDLISREIDVAITSDGLYEHESIERHELVQESFVLLLPAGAAAQAKDLRTLAANMPFLRYTSRTQSGQLIERHFRRLRLEIMPKFLFESPDDLVSAVSAGRGWSVVTPTQLAYSMSDPAKVVILPFPKPSLSRSITLIARRGEMPNVAAEICRVCRQVLAQHVQPRIGIFMHEFPGSFSLAEDLTQAASA